MTGSCEHCNEPLCAENTDPSSSLAGSYLTLTVP